MTRGVVVGLARSLDRVGEGGYLKCRSTFSKTQNAPLASGVISVWTPVPDHFQGAGAGAGCDRVPIGGQTIDGILDILDQTFS
jgi:hypothetical protein